PLPAQRAPKLPRRTLRPRRRWAPDARLEADRASQMSPRSATQAALGGPAPKPGSPPARPGWAESRFAQAPPSVGRPAGRTKRSRVGLGAKQRQARGGDPGEERSGHPYDHRALQRQEGPVADERRRDE